MQKLSENINTLKTQSKKEIDNLLHQAIASTKQHGADNAAVAVHHDSGFSVDVRMGETETVSFSDDKSISVTVFLGQRKGSASSTDTSPAAIDAMVNAACEIAKVSAEDPCFGLADAELVNNNYPDLDLYHPWNLTPTEAIERLLACEQEILSVDKRIMTDGVHLSTYVFDFGYANTNGCFGILNSTRHNFSCSLIAKAGAIMQRDYDYTTARCFNDMSSFNLISHNAAQRALSRLGAKKIKTQKAPVVFSSRLSSGLFGVFVNAISGSNLYRKQSFLLDKIGEKIFPENIRIHEQPYLKRGLGSSPFDGEGVPTRNNIFVENGILQQYALGSYAARKLGLKTTANSSGVCNLTIDPTDNDLQDILKKMGKGLLVTELMGHGINLITGDYSRGAVGFWVEDGQIQYPVEEVTIAGNLKDMFLNIAAVGKDINPNSATHCGSVLIAEMMVGGS